MTSLELHNQGSSNADGMLHHPQHWRQTALPSQMTFRHGPPFLQPQWASWYSTHGTTTKILADGSTSTNAGEFCLSTTCRPAWDGCIRLHALPMLPAAELPSGTPTRTRLLLLHAWRGNEGPQPPAHGLLRRRGSRGRGRWGNAGRALLRPPGSGVAGVDGSS